MTSRKTETLENILRAARAEFAEKGLGKAHIQSIAERAGVTKQLIYHYYQSKEQLFSCVLDQSSSEAMAELIEISVDDLSPKEALRCLLYSMFDQFNSDPELGSIATEGIRYHGSHDTPHNPLVELGPELAKKMSRAIERGIESKEFNDNLNANYLFSAACLLTSGAFTNRYVIAAVGNIDLSDEANAQAWKKFSADLILQALERTS